MARTLFSIFGETDGSSTTGIFTLRSEIFYDTVDYIRLDKGLKLKIWGIRITGDAVRVILNKTEDVTAATPDWTAIGDVIIGELPSKGSIDIELRRPILIHYKTGNEAIRFRWEQSTAAKSSIEIKVEVTDEEE